jgi:hypothetical protein
MKPKHRESKKGEVVSDTAFLLEQINKILVYTAPEAQAVKLCHLMIDEMKGLVKESDEWIAKWLRESLSDPMGDRQRTIAELIEKQVHWKWIQSKKFEMG